MKLIKFVDVREYDTNAVDDTLPFPRVTSTLFLRAENEDADHQKCDRHPYRRIQLYRLISER